MTATTSFFDDALTADEGSGLGRGGVRRDSRGRALLVPKGMRDIRVPYSSASGLADFISESDFLHKWEMRYLAIAMGRNPDLARLAASETYHTGLYAQFARGEKAASGRRVDDIIERALDRQKIHEKADYGTAFHQHTEPGAPKPSPLDEEMTRDVASFDETLQRECIRILETEVFTANDTTMSAGTYDHGVQVLGHPLLTGYVIADKKTGRIDPFHWAVQIASYAYGEHYNRENDLRQNISADINRSWGLVFHTPAMSGRTDLILVNLEVGWEMAQLAAQVRDGHERTDITARYKPASFAQRLEAANTAEQLRALWYSTTDEGERELVNEKARSL